MNPRDALHQQALLRDNLTKPHFANVVQPFLDDVNAKKSGVMVVDNDGRPSGRMFCEREQRALGLAETFYVSTTMTTLAVFAGRSLDDLDRFTADLWPTPAGFLLFEGGFVIIDVWGHAMVVSAMVWDRASVGGVPGTRVNFYTDLNDLRDATNQRLARDGEVDALAARMGRLHLAHCTWIADGLDVGPAEFTPSEDYLGPDATSQGWELAETATNANRVILSLLMLLGQTITVTTKHDLMPSNPKRARKMRVPAQVTVITLRTRSNTDKRDDGASQVEWQHRWFCRAHWRSVACGPGHPLAQEVSPGVYRARCVIAPYGRNVDRDDLPWVQTKKVYTLKR